MSPDDSLKRTAASRCGKLQTRGGAAATYLKRQAFLRVPDEISP